MNVKTPWACYISVVSARRGGAPALCWHRRARLTWAGRASSNKLLGDVAVSLPHIIDELPSGGGWSHHLRFPSRAVRVLGAAGLIYNFGKAAGHLGLRGPPRTEGLAPSYR